MGLSLRSKPLATGAKAPHFTLPDQDGNHVALSDLLARGPAVVYFYPKAFTAVCTAESCGFRDSHEDFTDAGASVVGISTDDVDTQRAFRNKHRLSFPLLSDADGKVHGMFGVRSGGGNTLGFMLNDRITFVIDSDGTIVDYFGGLLSAQPHIEQSIETIRGLAARRAMGPVRSA